MKKNSTFELTSSERKLLRLLKRQMRQTPAADYRIEKLVKSTGFNRTKLHQGFYFLFGVHIHVYLVEQRLALAKKLLRKTSLPVKAVATESGFKDEKYFFRFFRRSTSLTPIAYRKRHQQRRC